MDTKGQNTFTTEEIALIKKYIQERVKAEPSAQKRIRDKMRKIGFYGSDFGIYDCHVSDLEGLIRSGRIKVIGGMTVSEKAPSATPLPAVPTKAAKPAACATAPVKGLAAAEKRLIQGVFVSVGALSGEMVPDVPGLYCIKLRKGAKLPAKFGKVREDGIIYIGQASTSLRQRFWKQELNHIGAATFFRSIGAMLGYMPPKGSLVGKKNQNNFKFSPEDTESIRVWMRNSLIVNCIPFSTETMDAVEKKLIDTYRPLVNKKHNPDYSRELEAAKEKCREYARSK